MTITIIPFLGTKKTSKVSPSKKDGTFKKQAEECKTKTPVLANSGLITRNLIAPKHQRDYLQILKNGAPSAKRQASIAHKLASKYVVYANEKTRTAKITYDHYYIAYLHSALDFARNVKEGKTSYEKEVSSSIPSQFAETITPAIWRSENIDGVIETLEQEILMQIEELKAKSKKDVPVSSLEIDKQVMDEVGFLLRAANKMSNVGIDFRDVTDSFIFGAMLTSDNKAILDKAHDFVQKLSMRVMTTHMQDSNVSLPYYSDISKNVLRNADRNFDIFITYSKEDEKAEGYFTKNLFETLEDDSAFSDCKNLKKENTKLVAFNDSSNFDVIINAIKKMGKDKNTHYIVLVHRFDKVSINSSLQTENNGYFFDNATLSSIFKHKPKNVHYIFMADRDAFYGPMLQSEVFTKNLDDFQNLQIPMMDTNATKRQLILTKTEIIKEIGVSIDDEALECACDLAASGGSRYDKTIKLIKNVAAYYADKKVLTKQDISDYWQNLQKTDKAPKENSYEIIFDTKIGLDDIIGSPMTKQQASDVVYEITNFPQTKGYILYNADGEGGGRLKCAKAIAGEAKIPMVKISASDFAIRELDSITQNPMEAIEVKMTKLINLIRTQAQTAPNKTVMLFISDFDRFSSDPLYGISSIYEQQAFKKLQKEMKAAQVDKDYNIIVVGSSDMPELTNENIIRPGLFMDSIAIYSPRLKTSVKEVILEHTKKHDYSISGETPEEKDKILRHFSSICLGFSYVDIVDMLDKANILAKKSQRDSITIEDINEAYLSKLNGPTSELAIDNRQKEAIIRHEGGHALTLQFMYNLLKEQKDTLRIPDSVQNIALDPRGDFLGCVYSGHSDENTSTCNLETVLSEIVCCFGGNSAEEHFYDMEGSYGISQDMQIANAYARMAVLNMGLGAKSGYYIPDIDDDKGIPIFAEMEGVDYVKDVKVFLENAKTLSDKIIKCYDGFIREFSSKNISKFGTGKCIITGDEFAVSLKKWERKQSPQKRREINNLKKEALAIIQYTKLGKKYGVLSKYNPLYRTI